MELKKEKLLITPTILDAYRWYLLAPESVDAETGKTWKAKAFDQLRDQLGREKTDFPKAAKKGIEFEKFLYETAEKVRNNIPLEFNSRSWFTLPFCKEISSGNFQKTESAELDLGTELFLLYCRYDVELKNKIIDIKTTNKPIKKDYAFGKHQHIFYNYCSGKPFEYAVFQFENIDSTKVVDFKRFSYNKSKEENASKLSYDIKDFWDFLNENLELLELYLTKFNKSLSKDFIKLKLKSAEGYLEFKLKSAK